MNQGSVSFSERLRQQAKRWLTLRSLPYVGIALAAALLVAGIYWLASRPRGEELPVAFGKRRGLGAQSVNGTSVLADMFELEGFDVRTINRLSPRVKKEFDVIVWFPDDFEPPKEEQRRFLELWLAEDPGRTLVYVGRDYAADPLYWQTAQKLVAAPDAAKMKEREAAARAAHEAARAKMPTQKYARWFTARSGGKRVQVQSLSGPWAEGVDGAKTQIEVQGRLDVPQVKDAGGGEAVLVDTEVLLAGDGQPLVFRATDDSQWRDGQVIVVTNGSFLLNYALVNQEHRKLAAKLIEECGYPQQVAFLESEAGGPEVLEKDPSETGGLTMFRVWPINAIAIHLTIFGIIYCFARWPIFGRPKELPAENPADFGRHVAALGKLLSRTRNSAYAQSRLAQYYQQARRGSGKSHLR
jgi:hypothetical protein